MEYAIGHIFINEYPVDAVEWCRNNQCHIVEIEKDGDNRRFQIKGESPLSIEELKASKLLEINSVYNVSTSNLVSTYPDMEVLTFDKQEQEARAWQIDNSASTPLIDALVLGRGIDKAELVRRIIAKADTFALATGYLTGQRQRYEDMLAAAQTAEAVAAIVPDYALPEGLSL